ncbi:IS30 family transposase [Photobacterium swingsii]|uniref:IS30 family transposase n=1 Tax=Photobacterium swingsii TaxID=680026 RepID=UPI00352CCF57
MKYKQLTENERYTLSVLRKQGYNQAQIAKALGRHRSTISREVNRNSCRIDNAYRPSKAQKRTNGRRRRSRRNKRITAEQLKQVKQLLVKDWSPEQIVGHLKIAGKPTISHESIYQFIWKDKANGGQLWKHLRQATKKRRKRYGAYDSRGRLASKRHISERPASVETRKTRGHWEIDTVMGKGSKHCIVTLVERKTGYTLIGQLDDRTTASLNRRTIKIMNRLDGLFTSITADNGTEFHQYKEIENATGTRFYFANPHHSWERGTNENTNGLIRQYLPKGTSMATLTQAKCDAIAKRLNTRPRKRLSFKTPEESFIGYYS